MRRCAPTLLRADASPPISPLPSEWMAVSRRSKALAHLPGPEYGAREGERGAAAARAIPVPARRVSVSRALEDVEWERQHTIGACGDPPHDTSYSFAAYAIVLLVAAGLLVPAAIALLFGGVFN